MKIRIKPDLAAQYNAYQPGEIVTLPDAVAEKLIARGIADRFEEGVPRQEVAETQTAGADEAAIKRDLVETQTIVPDETAGGADVG